MFIVISLFVLSIVYFFDRHTKKIHFFTISLMYLPFSIAYEFKDIELFSVFFVFEKPKMEAVFYTLYGVLSLSIIAAMFLSSYVPYKPVVECYRIYFRRKKRIAFLYYSLALISVISFLINFQSVGFSPTTLFINPREYEHEFGSNFAVNYLYFLNVPAICLYIFYKKVTGLQLKFGILINCVLIVVSFFHGIKFTIFDTLLIPSFFAYILYYQEKIEWKKILIFFMLLALVFVGFMELVRGGTSSIVVNLVSYILPNYYNFVYSVEQEIIQFNFVFPLLFPDKIPDPFTEYSHVGPTGFLLNDKYNMYTGLFSLYSAFNIFGILILIPCIYVLNKILILRSGGSLFALFLATIFSFCLFFMFYFWAFTKTKYWYYLFVFLLVDIFLRIKIKK